MRTFIGVSLLTGVLMLPGVATAASCPSSGVHVDQGSPAAKQYGFPVNNARGETSGCSGKHSSAGGAGSQLFGAGVSPHKTSTQTSTHTATSHTTTTPKTTSTSTTSTTSTTATTAAAHKKKPAHRHKQAVAAVNATSPPSPPAKPVSASLAAHVTPPGTANHAGSSAWIALVGGGLLVLVLGTGAGLALKRRL